MSQMNVVSGLKLEKDFDQMVLDAASPKARAIEPKSSASHVEMKAEESKVEQEQDTPVKKQPVTRKKPRASPVKKHETLDLNQNPVLEREESKVAPSGIPHLRRLHKRMSSAQFTLKPQMSMNGVDSSTQVGSDAASKQSEFESPNRRKIYHLEHSLKE